MSYATRKQTRYRECIHKAPRGFDWFVVDPAGLVVREGWVAGSKRDAAAEARLAISELEGKS